MIMIVIYSAQYAEKRFMNRHPRTRRLMKNSGKTHYKRLGKKLGLPWTVVRDRELAGLTAEEKVEHDPLGMAEDRRQYGNMRQRHY